jgi:hypothetical protein
MVKNKWVSAAIFGTLLITSFAYGSASPWWFNFGLGAGFFGFHDKPADADLHDLGPAAEMSFNYIMRERQLLTIRGSGVIGLGSGEAAAIACAFMSPLTTTCNSSAASVSDAGVLYGYIYKRLHGYFSFSAGLSVVRANPPFIAVSGETLNDSPRYTVGVPFELQAFWTPTRYFGLGLIGFANANFNYPSVGGLIALQAGRLNF